jgi:thiosulfate/3-mercaptopyruvate sulfurtransferase
MLALLAGATMRCEYERNLSYHACRFTGKDPEPRAGLSSGHIPNSLSLPFGVFLQANNLPDGGSYTTFKPPEAVKQALEDHIGKENADFIISGQTPVATSCGSGMTAAVLWLGLKQLGIEKIALYDEVYELPS